MAAELPLIVIVGPTASGKTGLAVRMAQAIDGEIISADSRAIYRGMDIGTAKPSAIEQGGVRHFGLDLVRPDERFTVADFQTYAKDAIADIRSRGKVPILVGGSGLYVDSVIFDYNFTTGFDADLRAELSGLSWTELIEYCKNYNIELPENNQNKRYLIRAIEKNGKNHNNRQKLVDNCIAVGITTEKDKLLEKITARAKAMFDGGIDQETRLLSERYSFDLEAMKSNIYPIVWRMLNGEISREQAEVLSITDDWHLAKKQMTWFRRNPFIKWLPLDEIENYLFKKLE